MAALLVGCVGLTMHPPRALASHNAVQSENGLASRLEFGTFVCCETPTRAISALLVRFCAQRRINYACAKSSSRLELTRVGVSRDEKSPKLESEEPQMQEDVRTDSQCIRIHENQQRSVDAADGSPQPLNTSHLAR